MIPIGFRELAGVFPTSSHPHFISQKMWAMKGQEKESRQAWGATPPQLFQIFLLFWELKSRGTALIARGGKKFCFFICYITPAGSCEIAKVKCVLSSLSWLHSPSCLCSPSSPTLLKIFLLMKGQVPWGSTCMAQRGQVHGVRVEGGCQGLWGGEVGTAQQRTLYLG